MISNPQYKTYVNRIASIFCKNDAICSASVRARMLNYFNDNTFENFLQNIQTGRYYSLKYSNWHTGSNCNKILIDVRLMDIITGVITNGYWFYDAQNCSDKQFYYPDLNTLIGRMGYVLKDAPIMSKNNSDITKERLIYNPRAASYGITFVPPIGGGGGGEIVTTPEKTYDPVLNTPVTKGSSFDLSSLTSNPILLIGAAGVLFFLLMKK